MFYAPSTFWFSMKEFKICQVQMSDSQWINHSIPFNSFRVFLNGPHKLHLSKILSNVHSTRILYETVYSNSPILRTLTWSWYQFFREFITTICPFSLMLYMNIVIARKFKKIGLQNKCPIKVPNDTNSNNNDVSFKPTISNLCSTDIDKDVVLSHGSNLSKILYHRKNLVGGVNHEPSKFTSCKTVERDHSKIIENIVDLRANKPSMTITVTRSKIIADNDRRNVINGYLT
ncbi:unnamed protein product [Gordionus sp. m RMFG-2023]